VHGTAVAILNFQYSKIAQHANQVSATISLRMKSPNEFSTKECCRRESEREREKKRNICGCSSCRESSSVTQNVLGSMEKNLCPICVNSLTFFSLLALQPPLGVVFYSPLVGFSLLAYEVS